MLDISEPALEKAKAKVLQLVPNAAKVETKVSEITSLYRLRTQSCIVGVRVRHHLQAAEIERRKRVSERNAS